MADEGQEKAPGKAVSAGKPVRMTVNTGSNPTGTHEEGNGDGQQQQVIKKEGEEGIEKKSTDAPTDISELKGIFEKYKIPFEEGFTVDTLKEKLAAQPAAQQKQAIDETPEEKAQKEAAFEKRMLDLFLGNGGKVENFTAIKGLLTADVATLSVAEFKRELKESGFNDKEAESVIKEMYFQVADDELEMIQDETVREFEKRKREYATKLLQNRSLQLKEQAGKIFDGLKQTLQEQDLQVAEEIQVVSNVDAEISKMPRKVTIELGKANDQPLDPVEIEVSEEIFSEVAAILKDPAKREQLLYNQGGTLNIANITQLMVRNRMLENAVKVSLLEGQSRQVEVFKATFPGSPHDLGIGGQNKQTGTKGKIVSAGKPQLLNKPLPQPVN